jgi:hypothetical protein
VTRLPRDVLHRLGVRLVVEKDLLDSALAGDLAQWTSMRQVSFNHIQVTNVTRLVLARTVVVSQNGRTKGVTTVATSHVSPDFFCL